MHAIIDATVWFGAGIKHHSDLCSGSSFPDHWLARHIKHSASFDYSTLHLIHYDSFILFSQVHILF